MCSPVSRLCIAKPSIIMEEEKIIPRALCSLGRSFSGVVVVELLVIGILSNNVIKITQFARKIRLTIDGLNQSP